MQKSFRASKSRSQREGWCVLFRHPVRLDREGKNLRLRLGLSTKDEAEADRLVAQLNRLLADDTFWGLSARERAAADTDPRIVSIFYDGINAKLADPASIRDEVIPLPTREDGYTRTLLLGSTGAGKTTLLRQLIGSHPDKERFPSTSTARTTIFDTEIVLAPAPYRAVVSFLPADQVRFYIEECVVAAVSAAAEGNNEALILRRLLEHSEQRFRLSYILGTLSEAEDEEDDEELADEEETEPLADESTPLLSAEDREEAQKTLRDFLGRIIDAARSVGGNIANEFGLDVTSLKPADRDAFLDMLEHELHDNEDTQHIVDDIFAEVKARFDLIEKTGACERDRTGWATRWHLTSDDRTSFIKAVNWFSSNYARAFGRLLTPIVQGLRVAGPFRPAWQDESPRLVLMDGEGLGHTAESVASLPTSLTKRYEAADAILLVDNAIQPLLAGPQAALRSLVASGNEDKLVLVFTHFDQVKGDNLPTTDLKRNHVLAQLDGTIKSLDGVLGPYAVRSLRRALDGRVFFVANIHEVVPDRARYTRAQLGSIVTTLEAAIAPPPPVDATPVYDLAHLILAVRSATDNFHEQWNARLGFAYSAAIRPEHWTRVKALSRRFAFQWADEYDNLRPVADLIKLLSERLNAFIASPRAWEPSQPDEEGWSRAVGAVAREFFTRLHELVGTRLFRDQLVAWAQAYGESSAGSARRRANHIRGIYEDAAPIPGEVPVPEATEFLDAVRDMFRQAAEAAGAKVLDGAHPQPPYPQAS